MKISLMSDIHGEFYRSVPNWLPQLPNDADLLVLAGDIHVGEATIDLVQRISSALPNTQIIFVAGNHEFYKNHYETMADKFRAAFSDSEKIYFLENDSISINGIHFFGATLWTGFDSYLEGITRTKTMQYAKNQISDFYYITTGDDRRLFTPTDAREKFLITKQKIELFLQENDPKYCVIITHFPPSVDLRNPNFKNIDLVTSYFSANCDDIIRTHKPRYWFYGHHHWSERKMLFETECVTNQFCYPNEHYKNGWKFDGGLILELTKN